MMEPSLEQRFKQLIKEFSKGKVKLQNKLYVEGPLIYKIEGMEKPYIMVDYMYKMPNDHQTYVAYVNQSIKESCDCNMFPGYKSK